MQVLHVGPSYAVNERGALVVSPSSGLGSYDNTLGGITLASVLAASPGAITKIGGGISAAVGLFRGIFSGGGYENDWPKGLLPDVQAVIQAVNDGDLPGTTEVPLILTVSAGAMSKHYGRRRQSELRDKLQPLGVQIVSGYGSREWHIVARASVLRRLCAGYEPAEGQGTPQGCIERILRVRLHPDVARAVQQAANTVPQPDPNPSPTTPPITGGTPGVDGGGFQQPVQPTQAGISPIMLLAIGGVVVSGFLMAKRA